MSANADLSLGTNHDPCPAHPGQWYNKSTGDCSCGGSHSPLDAVLAQGDSNDAGRCVCARHSDGSVTTSLCPLHAEQDPCLTMARVTGKRRRGSVVRGVCSACSWSAKPVEQNDGSSA